MSDPEDEAKAILGKLLNKYKPDNVYAGLVVLYLLDEAYHAGLIRGFVVSVEEDNEECRPIEDGAKRPLAYFEEGQFCWYEPIDEKKHRFCRVELEATEPDEPGRMAA